MKIKETELVVIGAGPGGYTTAFYAADQGFKVILVERYSLLGGVCLNVGCIPSKALLHLASVKEEAEKLEKHGINFGKAKVNLEKMRDFKDSVIKQMTGGLKQLAKMRKVTVIEGNAHFMDKNNLIVKSKETETRITFQNAIIASGSSPVIPAAFDLKHERIMTSTGALKLQDIPKKLLVVGGGVIGLEMGSFYAAFDSEVTIVEANDKLVSSADRDVFKVLEKKIKQSFKAIHLNSKVEKMEVIKDKKVKVTFKNNKGETINEEYDRVLLSIGRKPNSQSLSLENAGVKTNERGFIIANNQMKTNIDNIYAIGDVIGGAMLAHKASHEGHVAVDVIRGKKAIFDKMGIPSVIYTDPEVAWVGLTENEAKAKNIAYKVGIFPWKASGRATAMGKNDGITKIIFEPKSERVLGVGMAGYGAGELIAEGGLALEMGAVVEDITETIHAHPTISETFMEAAESLHGLATHIYSPKRK